MVNVVENLTNIGGRIIEREPHPTLPGYDLVSVTLDVIAPVPGVRSLIDAREGTTMTVAVRRELLGDAGPGYRIHCRAKRTAGGAMCEGHPAPENFGISAPE